MNTTKKNCITLWDIFVTHSFEHMNYILMRFYCTSGLLWCHYVVLEENFPLQLNF